MKALVCEKFGPIDELNLRDFEVPNPDDNQVQINVAFASVNFPDSLIVQGLYQVKPNPPFIPGHELAGVVTKVGANVKNLKVGDRVVATPGIGGFAETVCVDAIKAFPLPGKMTMEQGASLTLTYGTSLHALQNCANLQKGETLLVLGASGGVGIAAIEIAKKIGAKVIAAASTKDKLEYCKEFGADDLINYEAENLKDRIQEITNGQGVNVVYDAVGGKYSEPALRSLAWRGRFLVVGFAAGEIPKIPLNLALLSERNIMGVYWGDWVRRNPQKHKENMELLSDWFAMGVIKPPVSSKYKFEQAKEAILHLASRKAKGKVVIEINSQIK